MAGQPPLAMAGSMGLEPTASGVTGRRYNQLNYDPKNIFYPLWKFDAAVLRDADQPAFRISHFPW